MASETRNLSAHPLASSVEERLVEGQQGPEGQDQHQRGWTFSSKPNGSSLEVDSTVAVVSGDGGEAGSDSGTMKSGKSKDRRQSWSVAIDRGGDGALPSPSGRHPRWRQWAQGVGRINWHLYLSLFILKILSTIYNTVRFRFLGDHAFKLTRTAAQSQWVGVMQEIIEEAIILPLFACMGSTINDKKATINKIRTGLLVNAVIYVPLTAGFLLSAGWFMELMKLDSDASESGEMEQAELNFVRLEAVGKMLMGISKFLRVALLISNGWLWIFVLAVLKTVTQVLTDLFLWSGHPVSQNMGPIGIALAGVVTESIVLLACLAFNSVHMRMSPVEWVSNPLRWDWQWLRNWSRIGSFSGLDSVVRNLAYMFLILRLANESHQEGQFFTVITFYHSWLLPPLMVLLDVLKRDIGQQWHAPSPTVSRRIWLLTSHLSPYLVVIGGLGLMWSVLLPLSTLYYSSIVQQPDQANELQKDTLLLLPAYLAFIPYTIMRAVLTATGATHLLAIATIFVNSLVGGTAILYYQAGEHNVSFMGIVNVLTRCVWMGTVVTGLGYLWLMYRLRCGTEAGNNQGRT